MKKLAAALCCVLLLGGCAISDDDLPNAIQEQLRALPQMELTVGNNMNKKFYSYYLPPGVGRRESNALSEVFMKNGYRIVMNFDPSAVVIHKFYENSEEETEEATSNQVMDQFLEPKLTVEGDKYTYTGNYLNIDKQVQNYTLQVIQSEERFLLYMDGTIVKLYTYVPSGEVSSSLKAMVRIMSSIQYNEDLILQNYSLKSLEETNKKSLDYLEQHLPSSGNLNDLLNGNEVNKGSGQGDSTE